MSTHILSSPPTPSPPRRLPPILGRDKLWFPVQHPRHATPVEIRVTEDQFAAAVNWSDRTVNNPDEPRSVGQAVPDKDSWANGQWACILKLIEKRTLVAQNGGYVTPPLVREHVDRHRYG